MKSYEPPAEIGLAHSSGHCIYDGLTREILFVLQASLFHRLRRILPDRLVVDQLKVFVPDVRHPINDRIVDLQVKVFALPIWRQLQSLGFIGRLYLLRCKLQNGVLDV